MGVLDDRGGDLSRKQLARSLRVQDAAHGWSRCCDLSPFYWQPVPVLARKSYSARKASIGIVSVYTIEYSRFTTSGRVAFCRKPSVHFDFGGGTSLAV
jgi:hypothetical protein